MRKKEREKGLTDYREYRMRPAERVLSFLFASALGYVAVFLVYGSVWIAIPAAVVSGFAARKPIRIWRKNARQKKLLGEFRDFLDCLYGSFSSGKNFSESISDAVGELSGMHGQSGLMVREVTRLRDGMRNGQAAEVLLADFAERSGLDDVRSFSDTVSACIGAGGNLRKTVANCREILSERISVEQEIAGIMAAGRGELYILTVLPFAAAAIMKTMGNSGMTGNALVVFLSRTAALVLFLAAFAVGRKMISVTV